MKLLKTWIDWVVWVIVVIFFAFMITLSVGCSSCDWEVVESDPCCGGHIHHHHTRTVYVYDDHHHHRRKDRRKEHSTPTISRPTPPSRPLPVDGAPKRSLSESRRPTPSDP